MAQGEGFFGDIINRQQMPYSMEAEQSVLGSIMLEPGCFAKVLEQTRPEHFYVEQHRGLFEVMLRMFQGGKTMDAVTIMEEAVQSAVFASPEEAKTYLYNLAQTVPTASHVEAYCKLMSDRYIARRVLEAAGEISAQAATASDAEQLLDFAEQKIYEIRQGKSATGMVHIRHAIGQVYETLLKMAGEGNESFQGISTGFSQLDRMITGLHPSDLILIAARPGMGKTAIALNIAYNVAKANKTVAIFSLEMSNEQLAIRFMSSAAQVESQKFRTGKLSGEDWQRLPVTSDHLAHQEIWMNDSAGITVGEMKAKLRRLRNADLVIIDYLQLMSSGGRRSDNRVQEVSEITRNLKIMAKELNVPVITLSQLSRSPEKREDKKPMLSDLRESGSIEQDADIVLMLYREDYYKKDEAEEHNTAICTVAKNRHGEVGDVKLGWDGRFTRFTTLEYRRDES